MPPCEGQSVWSQQPDVATQILAAAHFFIEPHEKSQVPALQMAVPPDGAAQVAPVGPHDAGVSSGEHPGAPATSEAAPSVPSLWAAPEVIAAMPAAPSPFMRPGPTPPAPARPPSDVTAWSRTSQAPIRTAIKKNATTSR